MLLIIERDDRDVQLQLRQEEESGSSSSGDESDSDDEVPFTRSTTGLTVVCCIIIIIITVYKNQLQESIPISKDYPRQKFIDTNIFNV